MRRARPSLDEDGFSLTRPERSAAWWRFAWDRRPAEEFPFHSTEPPEDLGPSVAAADPPVALDVGCGAGVITRFLASNLRLAVGLDIAPGAVRQARLAAPDGPARPRFLVADALALPFRDRTFGLVVDRGCMHSIPPARWAEYLREVTRVLAPGGRFHLYYAQPIPPLFTRRGLKARASILLGHRPPSRLHQSVVRRVCGPNLRPGPVTTVASAVTSGHDLRFSRVVCTRT
jgi:SAM-dependent methyltransferase